MPPIAGPVPSVPTSPVLMVSFRCPLKHASPREDIFPSTHIFLTALITVWEDALTRVLMECLAPVESKLRGGRDRKVYFACHHTSSESLLYK